MTNGERALTWILGIMIGFSCGVVVMHVAHGQPILHGLVHDNSSYVYLVSFNNNDGVTICFDDRKMYNEYMNSSDGKELPAKFPCPEKKLTPQEELP